MKRWILYLAAFGAVAFLTRNQSTARDVGKIEPVEVVRVSVSAGNIIIQTDTGQLGKGKNLTQAVDDMNQTASGEVFLDTAEFLLVTESALPQIPELMQLLRPSCCVCRDSGKTELSEIAAFLRNHTPEVTLRQYGKAPVPLPAIQVREERLYLVQP